MLYASDEQYFIDADGDGYGDPSNTIEACEQPSNATDNDEDCDDSDANVNPTLYGMPMPMVTALVVVFSCCLSSTFGICARFNRL